MTAEAKVFIPFYKMSWIIKMKGKHRLGLISVVVVVWDASSLT